MTSLDRLEKRINAAGIATRRNQIMTEHGIVPVLIADHDYNGPYPTQESMQKLQEVDRIAARYKAIRREIRGYYQATFLYEEVTPA